MGESALEKSGPVSVAKIIDYKYEMDQDWYMLKFKDQKKQPQWQQYRNLYGVDEMVNDYWKREKQSAFPTPGPLGVTKNSFDNDSSGMSFQQDLENFLQVNKDEFLNSISKDNTDQNNNFPLTNKEESSSSINSKNTCKNRFSESPMKIKWKGNLVKGKNKLSIGNIIDIIETLQAFIFLFESCEEEIPQSLSNLNAEKNFMEWNDIVGVIMIDKNHSCLLIFPNTKKIQQKLEKLGLDFSLNDEQLNNKPFFAIHKIISTAIYQNILDTNEFETSKNLKDLNLFNNGFPNISMYHDKLLELCANNKPKFINFSPKINFEKDEIINVMENLGAKYQTHYSEDVKMVLIHVLYEKQINFMPYLMNLKDLTECIFVLYKPKDVEVILQHGGFVTITTLAFSTEKDVIERVINLFNHQTKLYPNSRWEIVLNPYIKEYLAQTSNLQNIYKQNAKLSYLTILLCKEKKYIRYFRPKEFPRIFNSSKFITTLNTPPSMIKSLHFTMIKMHQNNWKTHRHYVVICADNEKEMDPVPIEGVLRLNLREFEMKFGSNNNNVSA
ncbi:2364_t:CDS:10 [Diversispora eburnea]|uniref:2364_t:CDS:1 n=1 Tax=Diversispora eburnea TaxID=1213867 RepID=A0A9N8V2F9_9GLOM|nr:2364_t:CDS:10 [Diversispora eburnea]